MVSLQTLVRNVLIYNRDWYHAAQTIVTENEPAADANLRFTKDAIIEEDENDSDIL